MSGAIYLGTQGWIYDDWIGSFYPVRTSRKEMLRLYSKVFHSVEIDSTYYAIPSENSIRSWFERTPPHFKFSVKLISEITHKKRLRESESDLQAFVDRVRLLGQKLGVVLIQLPPDFSPSEFGAFKKFCGLLPDDLRFAVEFRNPVWYGERTVELLEAHNVALTLADSKWIDRELSISYVETPTADFTYLRWLGPRELADFSRIQIDRTREMKMWAEAFARLTGKVDTIYGYFNNHYQGHSPASCNQFKALTGQPLVSPAELILQPSLF